VKTGKSTLINSLRGLRATHPLGAPVGVGEVTTEAKCYDFHETLPNVKLYDFPGAGTISHPEENYFL
jgi:ribosome biogenesis GTPase A